MTHVLRVTPLSDTRARYGPGIGIEQLEVGTAVAGGKDHAFGKAEAHLARGEIGDEDDVATDQLFRFGVGRADAGKKSAVRRVRRHRA